MNRLSLARYFRQYFILILMLWILFVLYPNPVNLTISVARLITPAVDPSSVNPLLQELNATEPVMIEREVLEKIPYRYDWEVYGMPWYFPTTVEVLKRGEGDCKARTLILASIFEAKDITYHINCSPTHMWVDYQGKEQTSLENPKVRLYQQDPETGKKLFQFPDIPFSDITESFQDSFWEPMPLARRFLLLLGLPVLVTVRLTLFKKRKREG